MELNFVRLQKISIHNFKNVKFGEILLKESSPSVLGVSGKTALIDIGRR